MGVVISDKMQKSRIVRVMCLTRHKKYAKIIKRYNKFKVHDEKNVSHLGDTVEIIETRPLSKEKHFRIARVIKNAQTSFLEAEQI